MIRKIQAGYRKTYTWCLTNQKVLSVLFIALAFIVFSPGYASADWLDLKLTSFQLKAQTAFGLICAIGGIVCLIQRKLIAMILFFVGATLMGWLVYSPKETVDTVSPIFK